MYVNTNPFLFFFVTNPPTYDQHLLEPFLNESISTESNVIFLYGLNQEESISIDYQTILLTLWVFSPVCDSILQ
ncbi:Deoxyguanosine kinase [Bienertia sinuspersici]